jgi:hypothetical protein
MVVSSFESLALSKFPRDAVFAATRDAMPRAVAYVEDVDRVVVDRRIEEGDRVELVNVWYVAIPIPKAIAGFVEPHMLVWTDHAVWSSATHTCHWKVTSHFFPRHVRCSGVTRYDEAMRGQATRVELRGEIFVDPSGIPGVPEIMQQPIARGIEEFVCAMFPSSLRRVVDGVSQYLSASVPPSR